jgi:small-conductance mechanosensitive channel
VNGSVSASAIGWTAIGWLVLMQLIASSAGGYLAGRLRTKWVNVHTHEVYFRDTAHGFLAWAVGLVITAAFFTSAATAMIGGAAAGAVTASGPAQSRDGVGTNGYLVDTLLRPSAPGVDKDNALARSEFGLIFANSLREGNMPSADRAYLSQVVAARTGVSQSDAEKRVDDAYTQARQAADAVRKEVAHSMYWTFLALLIGAFCASFAATIGGRERDRVPAM